MAFPSWLHEGSCDAGHPICILDRKKEYMDKGKETPRRVFQETPPNGFHHPGHSFCGWQSVLSVYRFSRQVALPIVGTGGGIRNKETSSLPESGFFPQRSIYTLISLSPSQESSPTARMIFLTSFSCPIALTSTFTRDQPHPGCPAR